MNIFYNTMHGAPTILMLFNDQIGIVKKSENGNIFYYDGEGRLVGFNIFLKQPIEGLTPGRLIINEKIKEVLIKSCPNLKIEWKPEFIVGEIKQCAPIRDTHLTMCTVDVKTEQLQIVCGANNVRVGLKTVVAVIGTVFLNGLVIQPAKLKGIDSYGMLCSQKELYLTQYNQTGIIELNEEWLNGSTFNLMYSNK